MKINSSKKFNNFFVWVIGCQQNAHDGTILVEVLKKMGLEETMPEDADIIFIIACAVRQTGVDRVFGRIKNWKNKKIFISGCVLDSDRKKLLSRAVEFWDIEKLDKLPEILSMEANINISKIAQENLTASSSVPIMYGCDNFCSYCATPYTRGRERSREISKIIIEVKNLIDSGKKNILLLGQNVNSYKIQDEESEIKNPNKSDFTVLLEKLNALEGNFCIAFTSNHPKDMSDDIIEAVAKLPKIKKEIHLPLQSGSDKILKAMNRPYSSSEYIKIIDKIKKASEKIQITTDVIVGFPGETEEDFQKTVKIFKKVGYKMAYINKYSPRVGTSAYALGDPIPWKEKQRRWHELDKILSLTRN